MKLILTFLLLAILSACGDGDEKDYTIPSVVSVSPPDGSTCAATNSVIKANFSEIMGSSFFNRTTFLVRKGGIKISGSVNYGGRFATFIPASNLAQFSGYTAVLTTGIGDSSGNPLSSEYVWGFVTGSSAISSISFATRVQPIFDDNCTSGCHESGGTASFLPLIYDVSYSRLANISSTHSTGGLRVKPCDPANSVLYKRVTGTTAGDRMPPSGSALTDQQKKLIWDWIDEGALDN